MADSNPADTSTPPEHPLAALGDLAVMPWDFAMAMHDWQVAWCRSMFGMCFWPGYPPHPHEERCQLEIPDPIEAAGEELFA